MIILLLLSGYAHKKRIISTKTSQKSLPFSYKFCDKNRQLRHNITKTDKQADILYTKTDKEPTKNYDLNMLQL
jgi:hypothetical protein